MRNLLVAGLLVAAMAVAGCDNPPLPAYQSQYQSPQITFTDWGLQHDLKISKAVTNRIGAAQLQVAVELQNNTDHTVKADYKYTFLDKNGIAVDNPSGWQLVTVPPREFQQFTITSMSGAADDFNVQIRPHQ